jgi:predicted GIY-YIG superfamily endonuclease
VGFTKDLQKRLATHNAGRSKFSQKYAPWKLENWTTFTNASKARRYERYLKSGSGYAFFKKYLI